MPSTLEEMSVFDVIWDLMVGIMILRPSFWYYALTFTTALTVRLSIEKFAPYYHMAPYTAQLVEWSVILISITVYSSLVTSWFEIPKVRWLRFAVGFTALFLMLLTEFTRRVICYEEGWRKGILEESLFDSEVFGSVGVVFGLMPWILSFWEKDTSMSQEKAALKSKM
ncbi:hypothetical protein F5884DRAFT_756929 [Xylogone sp. PMI_703]|nr:hypothetical protein F5884DRAFT_756929 [Xylogone sp. PMI_703]